MFLVFDWWLDVIWLKSHRNATNCIDFNIVIRILNTPVSAKMAQGQRKWHVVLSIPKLQRLHRSLQWRHNECDHCDGVWNHRSFYCLFRRRSKKTSKLRGTGFFVRGIHRWPVNSLHKGPVTRKTFPIDYVIMFEIWEWIRNFIPHGTGRVITYPCWVKSCE